MNKDDITTMIELKDILLKDFSVFKESMRQEHLKLEKDISKYDALITTISETLTVQSITFKTMSNTLNALQSQVGELSKTLEFIQGDSPILTVPEGLPPITVNTTPRQGLKPAKNPCKTCGGLISWDNYSKAPGGQNYPDHIDSNGNIIDSCYKK